MTIELKNALTILVEPASTPAPKYEPGFSSEPKGECHGCDLVQHGQSGARVASERSPSLVHSTLPPTTQPRPYLQRATAHWNCSSYTRAAKQNQTKNTEVRHEICTTKHNLLEAH